MYTTPREPKQIARLHTRYLAEEGSHVTTGRPLPFIDRGTFIQIG